MATMCLITYFFMKVSKDLLQNYVPSSIIMAWGKPNIAKICTSNNLFATLWLLALGVPLLFSIQFCRQPNISGNPLPSIDGCIVFSFSIDLYLKVHTDFSYLWLNWIDITFNSFSQKLADTQNISLSTPLGKMTKHMKTSRKISHIPQIHIWWRFHWYRDPLQV